MLFIYLLYTTYIYIYIYIYIFFFISQRAGKENYIINNNNNNNDNNNNNTNNDNPVKIECVNQFSGVPII